MKVQNLAALLGGTLKAILTIAGLLSYFSNSVLRTQLLVDNIFDLEDDNIDNRKK